MSTVKKNNNIRNVIALILLIELGLFTALFLTAEPDINVMEAVEFQLIMIVTAGTVAGILFYFIVKLILFALIHFWPLPFNAQNCGLVHYAASVFAGAVFEFTLWHGAGNVQTNDMIPLVWFVGLSSVIGAVVTIYVACYSRLNVLLEERNGPLFV